MAAEKSKGNRISYLITLCWRHLSALYQFKSICTYKVNIVLGNILVQLDETEGSWKKEARLNQGLNPSYPKHLLFHHKDKGFIVIRVQVSHFHRRFLFLPNPFPLAIQNFYLYVRVWTKFGLLIQVFAVYNVAWVKSDMKEKQGKNKNALILLFWDLLLYIRLDLRLGIVAKIPKSEYLFDILHLKLLWCPSSWGFYTQECQPVV